ncbi:MAG: hypothetical protein EXR05_06350 [Acetobacteraceae bacterium]|nr:hypothetical protein [Acetobacteraceae bacterium]
MAISFTPLHPVFVAECTGAEIAQDLTTERQIAFTKNFGDLEAPYLQIRRPLVRALFEELRSSRYPV